MKLKILQNLRFYNKKWLFLQIFLKFLKYDTSVCHL